MQANIGTASRKEVIRNDRQKISGIIVITFTVIFFMVGLALHSNLEARSERHERGRDYRRHLVSTALDEAKAGYQIVLAASEAVVEKQKAAEAALIAQQQADAARKAEEDQAAADALYKNTLYAAKAEGEKPITGGVPVSAAAPQGGWWPLFVEAGAMYGQDPYALWRVALCESCSGCEQPDPNADNGLCKGMFQFNPGTWLSTPEGAAGASIWDGAAQIRMAAWMWSQGRRGEWACQ